MVSFDDAMHRSGDCKGACGCPAASIFLALCSLKHRLFSWQREWRKCSRLGNHSATVHCCILICERVNTCNFIDCILTCRLHPQGLATCCVSFHLHLGVNKLPRLHLDLQASSSRSGHMLCVFPSPPGQQQAPNTGDRELGHREPCTWFLARCSEIHLHLTLTFTSWQTTVPGHFARHCRLL
jgi:hypothetical protein